MDVLTRIEIQTSKTNGRVNKLELWRSLIVGGAVVIVACGAIFAKLYVKDVSRKTAQEVLTTLESNYQLNINK